jgi:hypothetical protein
MFGFSSPVLAHVLISLVGIVTGFVVIWGLLGSRRLPAVTLVFLVTTTLTSAHGFLLPSSGLTPARIFGIISIVALVPTLYALYGAHLAGAWRGVYAAGAVLVQYLNFFVLIVQLFRRVPALAAAAPTQSEPPFATIQGITLLGFIVLGVLAVRRFHPQGQRVATPERLARTA